MFAKTIPNMLGYSQNIFEVFEYSAVPKILPCSNAVLSANILTNWCLPQPLNPPHPPPHASPTRAKEGGGGGGGEEGRKRQQGRRYSVTGKGTGGGWGRG